VDGAEERPSRRRIEIKLTKEQKDLIVRAAGAANVGTSEFVRAAAERAAREFLTESG
jgi:uncharacterized protein (DUF1778 family)